MTKAQLKGYLNGYSVFQKEAVKMLPAPLVGKVGGGLKKVLGTLKSWGKGALGIGTGTLKTGTGVIAGLAAGLGIKSLAGAGNVLTGWIIPIVLLSPAAAGAAVGALHSRSTSPTKLDEEEIRFSMESAEYAQALAEIRRRKEQSLRKGDVIPDARNERTIRL